MANILVPARNASGKGIFRNCVENKTLVEGENIAKEA